MSAAHQNKEDELAHGTRSRGERNGASKVTEAEVREIRALKGAQKDIAAKYGISKSAVSLIQKGKAWAWLKHDELSI